jgi:hypothetical protein
MQRVQQDDRCDGDLREQGAAHYQHLGNCGDSAVTVIQSRLARKEAPAGRDSVL